MQNPIRCGWSRACYIPTHRLATIFAFLLLLIYTDVEAQSDIGIAKTILGVDIPQSGIPGNFNVIFELNVQNTGTTNLSSLEIIDQLDAPGQYGAVFQSISSPPIIVASNAFLLPAVNLSYDGRSSQPNLLLGGGQLNPGQFLRLQFTAEVDPDATGAATFVTNQALAIAVNGGNPVSDFSDSGTEANTSNSGALGDTGGSDDPTPLTDCYDRIQPFVCNQTVNLSLNGDCIAVIAPGNLVEGEAEDCDDDFYPLGGYYQVTVKTLDGLIIEDTDPSTVNQVEFDALPYDAVMANVANIVTGNSCWVRINLQDKKAPICSVQNDLEARINLDGIDQGRDGNLLDDIDPSGRDDLQDEYILCNLIERNTVEPYFDQLEVEDFTDCSAVDFIDFNTTFVEVCDASDLTGIAIDMTRFNNARFIVSGVYTRTWSARDINGLENRETCEQQVVVLRPRADQILIDPLVQADCNNLDVGELFANSAPNFTVGRRDTDIFRGGRGSGARVLNREQRYGLEAGFSCGYVVQITEGTTTRLCGGSTKDFRSLSVIERCTQTQIYSNFQQIIKIEDNTAPVLSEIPELTLSTEKFTCAATGNIFSATTTDDCSPSFVDRVTIERLFPQSSNSANNFIASIGNGGSVDGLGLGIGTYRLTYYAADDCQNSSASIATLVVADQSPPVVICDDQLNLSLVPNGEGGFFARLQTDDLDEGSYDNCYPVIFRVRSTNNANLGDDEFGQFVEFNCEDLSNPDLMAEMLVIEDRDGDGIYPDTDGGLISSCMSGINLEDKVAPNLVCEDVTISCTDVVDLNRLLNPTEVNFRAPVITGGCSDNNTTTLSVEIIDGTYEGGCVAGSFIRRFTATRQLNGFTRSATCDQVVTVNYLSDWSIEFPTDYVITCGSGERVPPAATVEELLSNDGCDTWGVEVDEEVFDIVSDGGCQKIIRTYKFINWCTWSPNEAPTPGRVNRPRDLILAQSDIVKMRHLSDNFGVNTINDLNDGDIYDEEVDFSPRNATDGALVILNSLPGSTRYNPFPFIDEEEINNRANVVRVDANNYGHFTYTQIIKVVDNTAPVIANIGNVRVSDADGNCVENVALPVPQVTECKDSYTISYDAGVLGSGTLAGSAPNFVQIVLPNVPVSAQVFPVTYTVSDACGNSAQESFNILVSDATPPTARCVPGLSIDLDESGEAEIWASDFDFNSSDGCSAITAVTFSDPLVNPLDTAFMATCNDLGTQNISIFILDAAGNVSVCNTLLNITSDNPREECGMDGLVRISGNIATENGLQVEGVAVHLAGTMDEMHYTDVSGMYEFSAPDGSAVSLQPQRNDDALNGVSTHDLVLIRKHILGLQSLDSPYKIIAADINRSTTVTTFDLVELRKVILGINSEFSNNQSWCFIDKNYAFPDALQPWSESFPERVELQNISNSELSANFIAIKTGDVNGSAIPNNLVNVDERSAQTLELEVTSEKVNNQQVITFRAVDLQALEGLQFSLQFDAQIADLQLVKYGILQSYHVNSIGADLGKLTFSWNAEQTLTDNEEVLFQLVFAVNDQIDWNNFLTIDESRLAAEAYVKGEQTTLDVRTLQLQTPSVTTEEFALFQNVPNPFHNATTVSFYLPQAEQATLNIYSTTGQLVHTQSGNFASGLNQIELQINETISAGLLYYTLETPSYQATRKMYIVK